MVALSKINKRRVWDKIVVAGKLLKNNKCNPTCVLDSEE